MKYLLPVALFVLGGCTSAPVLSVPSAVTATTDLAAEIMAHKAPPMIKPIPLPKAKP